MSNNQLRKLSTSLLSLEIRINEGMITAPTPNLKSKNFYVLVETDQKAIKTEHKKGLNPKWKHSETITSSSGDINFSMFQKGTVIGKDILMGFACIKINNVKAFKIHQNLDLHNKKGESVGSINVALKIKSQDRGKGNKGDQGTRYEIQCDGSPSISLENEEEEAEEEVDEDGQYVEQYEGQSMIEEQIQNYHMLGQGPIETLESESDRKQTLDRQRFGQRSPNLYEENAEYPEYEDGEEGSDESPVPDDEDKDNNLQPMGHNDPGYLNDHNTKRRQRKQQNVGLKQNFRSTSQNKKLKNQHNRKNLFKNRKASDRSAMQAHMFPRNVISLGKLSRNNPNNLSHAQTHYSPASIKEQRMVAERVTSKNYRPVYSKSRMVPSQSHGPGLKMRSGVVHPYGREKRHHGMYTPLVNNFQDQRYSTFDQEFYDDGSENEYQLYYDEETDQEMYIQGSEEQQQRMINILERIRVKNHSLKRLEAQLDKRRKDIISMAHEVELEREELELLRENLNNKAQALEDKQDQLQRREMKIHSNEKILKQKLEQASKQVLKQNNSTYFKKLDFARDDRSAFKNQQAKTPNEKQYMNEYGNASPNPYIDDHARFNNDYHEVDNHNLQKKYAEDYDVNKNYSQQYEEEYDDQDNYTQSNFPQNSNRNLNQEFARNSNENRSEQNYDNGMNQSYGSDDMPHNEYHPMHIKKEAIQMVPRNDFGGNRQPRFTGFNNDQERYILEMQRSQERQKQMQLNTSNQYYNINQDSSNRSPMMNNLVQNNMRYQHQFMNQDGRVDESGFKMGDLNPIETNSPGRIPPQNMGYPQVHPNATSQMSMNHPYQLQYMTGGSNGEANMMSGSSTDRFKPQNQGLQKYLSTGQVLNNAGPNTGAFNSQTQGVMPDQPNLAPHVASQKWGKDHLVNPPTFHPYHHLQNSSHINSLNSVQTPTHASYMMNQANAKMLENQTRDSLQAMTEMGGVHMPGKPVDKMGYESQFHTHFQYPGSREDSQDRINPHRQFIFDNYKGLEQQNSIWEGRNQQMHIGNTMGSIQEHPGAPQDHHLEQVDSKLQSMRETADLRARVQPVMSNTPEENQEENLLRLIRESQEKLNNLKKNKPQRRSSSDDNIKILQGAEEEKFNINNNVEKYINRSDKDDDIPDADEYIQRDLEKNKILKEQIMNKKKLKNEEQAEKVLINKMLKAKSREDDIHQTPQKKVDQSVHSIQSKHSKDNNHIDFPQHITGSMRKIRNSPVLAENEHMNDLDGDNEYSPNSIIPNHYNDDDAEDNTVCRVQHSASPDEGDQRPTGADEDDEEVFKPDPDLLNRLNANMFKNDRGGNDGKVDYVETEQQRIKRETRERIEKEREEERQKLFELFNNPKGNSNFWGGDAYDDEDEDVQDDRGNVSVNSITEEYKQDPKPKQAPQITNGKYLNGLNQKKDSHMHNSSKLNAYEQEEDGHEALEFMADPLNRKNKVNEVINRVQLDLIEPSGYDSIHSESQKQSAQNTIDECRAHVLRQQLKNIRAGAKRNTEE